MASGGLNMQFEINGMFDDQKGIVEQGPIVGYNGNGIPCRIYTWINPKDPELKTKTFEAFDDQIDKVRIKT